MKTWAILGATVVALVGAGEARAYGREAEIVQSFYHRYLHRPVDEAGLHGWVQHIRCGMSVGEVEARILGSDEYYITHGACPRKFIIGMCEDILGRTPRCDEVDNWVCELQRCGCRIKIAAKFLFAAGGELARRHAPPPPPPAYNGYDPGYTPRPAYPPEPEYLPPEPVPVGRYGKYYPKKKPGVTISIGYRSYR
jgi:hypothetical protein